MIPRHRLTIVRTRERQLARQAKIDRGYDDYLEGRVFDVLCARNSAEWKTELAKITSDLGTLDQPTTARERRSWRGVWDEFRNWLVANAA